MTSNESPRLSVKESRLRFEQLSHSSPPPVNRRATVTPVSLAALLAKDSPTEPLSHSSHSSHSFAIPPSPTAPIRPTSSAPSSPSPSIPTLQNPTTPTPTPTLPTPTPAPPPTLPSGSGPEESQGSEKGRTGERERLSVDASTGPALPVRRNSVSEGPSKSGSDGKRFGTWRGPKVRTVPERRLSVITAPSPPPEVREDVIHCVVMGTVRGMQPFLAWAQAQGDSEGEVRVRIGGKVYALHCLSPSPLGWLPRPAEWVSALQAVPKELTGGDKVSRKECKGWKAEVQRVHPQPNILLLLVPPESPGQQEKGEEWESGQLGKVQQVGLAIGAAAVVQWRGGSGVVEQLILCALADNRGKVQLYPSLKRDKDKKDKKDKKEDKKEKKEAEKKEKRRGSLRPEEKKETEKKRESGKDENSFLLAAPKALKGIVPKGKTKSQTPEDIVRETLQDLLERGSRLELSGELDLKVLHSLLFNTPEKIVRKVQEKVHHQAPSLSPLFGRSIFSRCELKVSKFHFSHHVGPSQRNLPIWDSLTLTNNCPAKATYRLENNYFFSQELWISFFPREGEVDKGKSVDIEVLIVPNGKIKLREIFVMDVKVLIEEEEYLERFYLTVAVDVDEPSPDAAKFWEVDPERLDTLKVLGSGASAAVFLCSLAGVEVAVKKWEFGRLDAFPTDFSRELETLIDLRHTNVVSFVGAVTTHPGKAFLITEYLAQGGLDSVLQNPDIPLPFPLRLRMALDANRGMLFMHQHGKLHRDLKSLNLLVDHKFTVKVADFGESRDLGTISTMTKGIGTYLWMAPEIVNLQEYSFAADVYSFGMVLWELMERKLPEREMEDIIKGKPLPPPKDCPKELVYIIQRCCEFDPAKRPTFQETLEMLEFLYRRIQEEEDKKVEQEISAIPVLALSDSADSSVSAVDTHKTEKAQQQSKS